MKNNTTGADALRAYASAFRNMPAAAGAIMNAPYRPTVEDELIVNSVLAKIGVEIAQPDGSLYDAPANDLYAFRNDLKRAINRVNDETRAGKVSNEDALVCVRNLGALVIKADSAISDKEGGARPGNTPTSGFRNVRTGENVRVIGREHAGRIAAELGVHGQQDGTLGDFFRGVAGLRTTEGIRNALSEGTSSAGGYAVPSWLFPNFFEALVAKSSLIAAGARILPLRDTAKTYRFARVETVPTAAWRSEAGAVAQSDPAFSALDLTPQSLAFYFKVSRELLADSLNIDEMLRSAIAQAFAKEIDRAGLRGSGTLPEVRGLLNTSGIAAVTNGANGATGSSIKWANLNSAYQSILEANGPAPTAVIMAPRTLIQFANLADTTTQPLKRPNLLEPVQFIATSQVPINLTIGTSNDCTELYVGDFTEFVIGMREEVSILKTDVLHAGTGEIGFYCHARVDVGVLHAASFAKITGVRAG